MFLPEVFHKAVLFQSTQGLLSLHKLSLENLTHYDKLVILYFYIFI